MKNTSRDRFGDPKVLRTPALSLSGRERKSGEGGSRKARTKPRSPRGAQQPSPHPICTLWLKPHCPLHEQGTHLFIPQSSVKLRPYLAQCQHLWIKMETPSSLLCPQPVKYVFENTWKDWRIFLSWNRSLDTSGVGHCILRAPVHVGDTG